MSDATKNPITQVVPGSVEEEEIVFEQVYWRPFNRDRVIHHEPLTEFFHDHGVGTWILPRLEQREQRLLAIRLAKTQTKVRRRGYRMEQLVKVLQHIERVCGALGIDENTCSLAASLAHKLSMYVIRHRDAGKAAVALYAALVSQCYPSDVIAEAVSMVLGEYSKDIEFWIRRLITRYGLPLKCTNQRLLVSRIISMAASRLNLPDSVRLLADRLAMLYYVQSIPRGLAAASVYAAMKLSDMYTTEDMVAEALNITDASVRNALKKMGLTVVYYYCADRPMGSCIKLLEWRQGVDSVGLRSPGEFAIHVGAKDYVYELMLGKPVKLYLAPRGDGK